jgi:hypothetical protein
MNPDPTTFDQLIAWLTAINPKMAAITTAIVGVIAYWNRSSLKPIVAKLIPQKSQDEKDFAHLNALMERAERSGCAEFRGHVQGCLICFYNKSETK